jgi:serine protease
MSLEVLTLVLESAEPPSSTQRGEMPLSELRFVLEFRQRPDPGEVQSRLVAALRSDQFVLEPMFASANPHLDPFLLLRIPGVERTLPTDVLFEAAYALAGELDAISVEPDVGSRFFEDPAPPAEGPRGEAADAIRRWCFVDATAPADHLWALNKMAVPAAWEADAKQGAGIIVAQPDTGVIPTHVELAEALDRERWFNVLNPDEPPIDPLTSGMANPGHGTATASCVASRGAGGVTGAAPKASIAPIRCINDVKVFDAAPVARAIDHARLAGCHVITMSLGGVPSRALRAAVKAAVEAELIVLAASGNCVRYVVFPARYDECIAVAAINVDDVAWKGSCRGKAVDVSAPGENVWRADPRAEAETGVTPGQGTSFAVAITAGVAALWLAHHGRDKLIAEARSRGVRLQDLFRSALVQTARRPAGWDSSLGAGVVDAAAVQSLDPKQISIVRKESAVSEDHEVEDLVRELSGDPSAQPPDSFDYGRYGLELSNVMMERARREGRSRNGTASETGLQSYRPSKSLTKALEGTSSAALEAVRESRGSAFAPALRVVPSKSVTRELVTAGALRILGSSAQHDSRESAAKMTRERASVELAKGGDALVDSVLAGLDTRGKRPGADSEAIKLVHGLLAHHGRGAVSALARTGTTQTLTRTQRVSTEALIKLAGRPALCVRNGNIDFNDAQIGQWQTPLVLIQHEIPRLVQSVGRIDVGGAHVGTGFVICEGLVMTNRHVLEVIAAPVPTSTRPKGWVLAQEGVTIDFIREHGSTKSLQFAVKEVVFAGPTPTNDTDFVDFTDLDMAILRIETVNSEGQPSPPPLSFLKGEPAGHASQDVLIIGYPAQPASLPLDSEGKLRRDVIDALVRIFGLRYGVKYLSPGAVTAPPGSLQGDPLQWVLSHDATTLGGNSGSCVIRYGPQPGIIGLHFAGEFERANYAHAIKRVLDSERLPRGLMDCVKWLEE